jgi:probable F420-dependent oxidoreductase
VGNRSLDLGLSLVMRGRTADRASAVAIAEIAEELGYHSLWVSDHFVFPPAVKTHAGSDFPQHWREGYLESVTTLAWLAGVTTTVRLGTSAMVLPLRNPVATAKQLGTLDLMSEGRLLVAVTAGYAEDEFDVVGVPFDERVPRFEEYVRLMRAMWSSDPASFEGRFFQFDRVNVGPLPHQRPGPPLLIAGHSAASIRRAAEYGDGWHPAANTPDELAPKLRDFHRHLVRVGRTIEAVPISVKLPFLDPGLGASFWIDAFSAFREQDVTLVVLDYVDETLPAALQTIEWFEAEVRPSIRRP